MEDKEFELEGRTKSSFSFKSTSIGTKFVVYFDQLLGAARTQKLVEIHNKS